MSADPVLRNPDAPARGAALPYLFAYDVGDSKRRREILKCLARWRADGQYSVHETWLRSFEVRDLAANLLDLVDRKHDQLLMCRLRQFEGGSSVFHLFSGRSRGAVIQPRATSRLESLPSTGAYLVAYDIRDSRRLQQVQRVVIKKTAFLQRSVYLFQGRISGLSALLEEAMPILARKEDDVRIYTLTRLADIWFLSGSTPAFAQARCVTSKKSLWLTLRRYLGLR